MTDRTATLYRMVLPEHECPFGVRAKQMLDDAGWTVDEHILTTRDDVEAFKLEHRVATTPQVFVDGRWDPLESTCRHASLSIL